MFVYIWTLHLADEIAFSSNDLLQPGPEGAAGSHGDVAEDLHDGGYQGLFFYVRGSVNTSPDTPHFHEARPSSLEAGFC